MSNEIPKTIHTNEVRNPIDMFAYPFVKLVKLGDFEYVYKAPETFFVVEDGFCFCTPHFELFETYRDFVNAIQKLKQQGFEKVENYEEALQLEFHTKKEYEEFKNSDFYNDNFKLHKIDDPKYQRQVKSIINANKSQYEKYLKAKEMGFKLENNYDNAQRINCENVNYYNEFINSDFFDNRRDLRRNKNNYKRFIKAKQEGFKSEEQYNAAHRLGINDYETYEQFLESGCETKEEFERVIQFQENLPNSREGYKQKIQSIKGDAKKALESGFLSEYVRLKYLLLEKYSELLYIILYKVPLDDNNELHIEDIIHKIEDKVNQSIVSIDKLHTWRITRNDIVHEHYKVKDNELENAKKFFNGVEMTFESLLNKFN